MSDASLPAPLVPPEVNLAGLPYMPLYIERLRKSKSWLGCKRRPELAFYLINLWSRAWGETTAASIEDDDDVLADAAGCDPRRWRALKAELLRGWVKCSDGRLYHPVVAELAIEAWEERKAFRDRMQAVRAAKAAKRRQHNSRQALVPPCDSSLADGGDYGDQEHGTNHALDSSKDHVPSSITDTGTASHTAVKGKGKGKGKEDSSVPNGTAKSGEAPANGQDTAGNGDLKAVLFHQGLAWLAKATGRPPDRLRSWLGKLRKDYGDAAIIDAIALAQRNEPSEPIAYIAAALKRGPPGHPPKPKPDFLKIAGIKRDEPKAPAIKSTDDEQLL